MSAHPPVGPLTIEARAMTRFLVLSRRTPTQGRFMLACPPRLVAVPSLASLPARRTLGENPVTRLRTLRFESLQVTPGTSTMLKKPLWPVLIEAWASRLNLLLTVLCCRLAAVVLWHLATSVWSVVAQVLVVLPVGALAARCIRGLLVLSPTETAFGLRTSRTVNVRGRLLCELSRLRTVGVLVGLSKWNPFDPMMVELTRSLRRNRQMAFLSLVTLFLMMHPGRAS